MLGPETGLGIVYADPAFGLMVDATLHLLVAHQDSRYDECGFSGAVRFAPGAAGRGLSLNVTRPPASRSCRAHHPHGFYPMPASRMDGHRLYAVGPSSSSAASRPQRGP